MSTVEDGIIYLDREEARDLFDRRAREEMGMSGEEFVRRWRAGEFDGQDEENVIGMLMLLPLVNENAWQDAATGG